MLWDVFCRVIDNWGDVGVSWRLAADLAARDEGVRLWIDDPSALAWMAPQGAAGVDVAPFEAAAAATPGDVAVEAFGCSPPAAFLERMARTRTVWIDLEHLSAERYVERSHGLPSPQSVGPAAGLTRWFFFPGYTAATGGLLREPGLAAQRAAFDRDAWLAGRGLAPHAGERVVTVFSYANPALPALIERLAQAPTLLLVAAGEPTGQVGQCLGPTWTRGQLRAAAMPRLPQPEFDRLLWAADLNFVRGEDSLVRAIWADRPWVWQAYAQTDGAHAAKLDALLEQALAGAAPALAADVRRLSRWWNGLAGEPAAWPDPAAWHDQARRWAAALHARPDLATVLLGFVAERR